MSNCVFSCRKKKFGLDFSDFPCIINIFPSSFKTPISLSTHGQEGSIFTNKISRNSKFVRTFLLCICVSSPKVVITFFIIKHCPRCQLLSLSALKFREQRRPQLIPSEILSEIIQMRQNLFELCLEQVTEFQIQ